MADTRIQLTCRHCGESISIGAGYYGSYDTRADRIPGGAERFVRELDKFFSDHEMGRCTWDRDEIDVDCSNNARAHFIILEECEKYNPETNEIVDAECRDDSGNRYYGTIKLPEQF